MGVCSSCGGEIGKVIKRYTVSVKISYYHGAPKVDPVITLSEDGDWCKWKDVKAIIKGLNKKTKLIKRS